MVSLILVIGTQRDELALIEPLQKFEEYEMMFIPSIDKIPSPSQFNPNLTIMTSDLLFDSLSMQEEFSKTSLLLIVGESMWEQLNMTLALNTISNVASTAEFRYRIKSLLSKEEHHSLVKLGVVDWMEDSHWWDMLSMSDWITGLNNKVHFLQELEKTISQARRYKHSLSCLLLRIDNYESFRQEIGEDIMDDILEEIAGIFDISIRDSDMLARIDSDLFGFILLETDETQTDIVINRIIQYLQQFHFKHSLSLSFSFGVATLSEEITSIDMLLSSAHRSLDTKNNHFVHHFVSKTKE